MEKITSLTEAQTARFGEFRDDGLRVGLSTTPGTKEQCEEAVSLAYRCAGLEPPQEFVHLASPLDAWLFFYGRALKESFLELISKKVPSVERFIPVEEEALA
jgi:hypothetical protein